MRLSPETWPAVDSGVIPGSPPGIKGEDGGKGRDRDFGQFGQDYLGFCRLASRLTGVDIFSYKSQQMHRRLDSYRARKRMADFASLWRLISTDESELRNFVGFLTINVSEFFRNPDQWAVLKEKVLPIIQESTGRTRVRAWSAGVACGQEVYSLAILLQEMGAHGSTILGTDLDESCLRRAEAGIYRENEVLGIPKGSLERFFVKTEGEQGVQFALKESIKRMVSLKHHDLLSDEYPVGFDLVVCRNVLIYFNEESKHRVLENLVSSLRPGGVLFTGATEAVMNPAEFGLTQIQPFFYRRASAEVSQKQGGNA